MRCSYKIYHPKLVATKMYSGLHILLLIFFVYEFSYTQLPQDHQWQIDLRNEMANFELSDFEIPIVNGNLPELEFIESFYNDMDRRFQLHSMTRNRGRDARPIGVGRYNASYFLLSSIESDGVKGFWRRNLRDAAQWINYDNPGNPYYDSELTQRLVNRVFVMASAGLIMMADNESGFWGLAGGLNWYSWPYFLIKPNLSTAQIEAFEEGLRYVLFERIQIGGEGQLDSNHQHGNISTFGLTGIMHAGMALGGEEHQEIAEYVKDQLVNGIFNPSGFIIQARAYDADYHGTSMESLSYMARASSDYPEYDFLRDDLLPKMWKLHNHLTFPEPNRNTLTGGLLHPDKYPGPSHFNETMSTDTWSHAGSLGQDAWAALTTPQAYWKMAEPEAHSYLGHDWPGNITLSNVQTYIDNIHERNPHGWGNFDVPSDAEPTAWGDQTMHHYSRIRTSGKFLTYKPGFYDTYAALYDAEDIIIKHPFLRGENFIRSFPKVDSGATGFGRKNFLSVKFDNYSALIFTGPLSWADTRVQEFGGGNLSAFWSEETGPVIMGRNRARPMGSAERDQWNEADGRTWRIWAVHAISGENNGGAFSSARISYPNREYALYDENDNPTMDETEAVWAKVEAWGQIGPGTSTTMENNNLSHNADYNREFILRPEGVSIKSSIESNGVDPVNELWEMIPVYYGISEHQETAADVSILFEVNDEFIPATTALSQDVTRIRIDRFFGSIYINFSEPRSINLSPMDNIHNYGRTRVIMVDLLGDNTTMPTETSVEYTIIPAPRSPGNLGLLTPEQDEEDVETGINFHWEEAARTDTYQLQVSTQQNFASTFYDNSSITETYHNVSGLSYNTQYYWRVRALNEHGEGNWSEVRSFTTVVESIDMEIPVSGGWNLVSTYVNPGDPALDNIFSGMIDNLVLVKDQSGAVYWPEYEVYDLDAWDPYSGYQVYVNDTGMFVITGTLLAPESNPIHLSEGWNQIAYLRKTPMPVGEALAGVYDKLDIVSNSAGDVFWPDYEINTLGDMVPGQGYKLHVSESAELTYPANSGESPGKIIAGETTSYTGKQEAAEPMHYIVDFPNTGDYAILLLISSGFGDGDEIGVWSPGNDLVGSGIAHSGRALVTVWGKNPVWNGEDNNRGAVNGTVLSLTQWSAEEQREYPLPVSQVRDVSGASLPDPVIRYESDAVNIVEAEGLKDIPGRYTLEQNYPNPFNPATTIRYGIPEQSNVRLEVYNALGQRIKTLVDNEEQQPGYYQVIFNAANIASGVYFYRLQAGGYTEIKRMVLVR